ncbi:MAG: DUF1326 domain-containing protein [Acidobacteria bacterium]|nr:DUF1326 domain-containing protein [Acidobacteriota bacterium]
MKLYLMLGAILLASAGLGAEIPAAVTGDYAEARSCHVYTCGCLFSGELVTDGRHAILAWNITGGKLDGVSLEGVKVAAVVVGEGNLSVPQARRKSALYLDGIERREQEQAAVNLIRRHYAEAVGEVVALHVAPIRFREQGGTLTVEIGGAARMVMRKARIPEDAHPGSSRWHGPFIPLSSWDLETLLYSEYNGSDFSLSWRHMEPAINGYAGSFSAGF